MIILGTQFVNGTCTLCGAQPEDAAEHAVSHLPAMRRTHPRQPDACRVRLDSLLRARSGA